MRLHHAYSRPQFLRLASGVTADLRTHTNTHTYTHIVPIATQFAGGLDGMHAHIFYTHDTHGSNPIHTQVHTHKMRASNAVPATNRRRNWFCARGWAKCQRATPEGGKGSEWEGVSGKEVECAR